MKQPSMVRKHDVAVAQRGWPENAVVVGKITTRRARFGYAISELRADADLLKSAKVSGIPRLLERLDERIQAVAECGDAILNEFGDTDPRHDKVLVGAALRADTDALVARRKAGR